MVHIFKAKQGKVGVIEQKCSASEMCVGGLVRCVVIPRESWLMIDFQGNASSKPTITTLQSMCCSRAASKKMIDSVGIKVAVRNGGWWWWWCERQEREREVLRREEAKKKGWAIRLALTSNNSSSGGAATSSYITKRWTTGSNSPLWPRMVANTLRKGAQMTKTQQLGSYLY